MPKSSVKIENSIYKKHILECIEKGMNANEIERHLAERGIKLTNPTIRKYMRYVQQQGLNVTQFKEQAESNALQINEKISKIPELTTIFTRRNFLLEDLLERRKKALEFVNEGKRTRTIFQTVSDMFTLLNKLRDDSDEKLNKEAFAELRLKMDFLQRFINQNFLKDSIYPQLEDTIRKYTMDIHELCKYVEQWTSKYEIEALMEKLTEMITKAAVSTFGPLLKKQNNEERQQYIDKFIKEVESAVQDLKDYQLKLGEKFNEQK